MLLIKPELLTFKAVCGSSFALQQQAETPMRDPGEGLGASLGTGTASRAWEQQGWHQVRCALGLFISLHDTRSPRTRRSGKGMKGDGCKGLRETLAGEERLALKSEIITANLGLKPEGNEPRGK